MIRNNIFGLKGILILVVLSVLFLQIIPSGVLQAKKMKNWSILENYNIDLDNDGKPEQVLLSSEIETDKDGNILWDDSQWWKLSIFKDKKEEVLFKEYITLGSVNVSLGVKKGNDIPSIVLVKDDEDTLVILQFLYDKKTKTYQKEKVLSIDKKVSSAIPNPYQKVKKN